MDEEKMTSASPRALTEWKETYYDDNDQRGCGQYYGFAAVKDFLDDNDIVCIIRGWFTAVIFRLN